MGAEVCCHALRDGGESNASVETVDADLPLISSLCENASRETVTARTMRDTMESNL